MVLWGEDTEPLIRERVEAVKQAHEENIEVELSPLDRQQRLQVSRSMNERVLTPAQEMVVRRLREKKTPKGVVANVFGVSEDTIDEITRRARA